MPRVKVNGKTKKFPYTKKGKKAAKVYAKKTGGKMEVNRGGKKVPAFPSATKMY